MEGSADLTIVDDSSSTKMATAPREIGPKRKGSDSQVTSFQTAIPLPDLLDPSTGSSDPTSSSDPSDNTSDDTSPLCFMGTPYSTSQQYDYPFPISNAPRDPAVPPTPLPSALPIASSLASAPSIATAAASSDEASESAATNPLPSMVSTIAASLDLPNNISELRSLLNQSCSSLNSTHSGHTKPVMIPVASSGASIRSMSSASPANSLHGHSQVTTTGANSQPITSPAPRQKGRHSLSISPMPPPPLSIHANIPKPVHSPQHTRRPKAMTVSSTGSTGSETSPPEPRPTRSRPPSGSHSSLSIASMQFMSGPGEPPIPPSLLTKLNRPRNTSNSTSSSYFSSNAQVHQTPNSRDFFSSPGGNDILNASAPSSPLALGTDSSVEFFKTTSPPPSKSGFGPFRPLLGRSNSSTGYTHNHNNHNSGSSSYPSRPFFTRSTTANPQLQSRAYAQHLRHQQQQQLKRQEDQRKKMEKEKEKKEKKEKKERKGRRSSLSLTRSQSSSSSSSAKTKSSTSVMSKSPSSASVAEGFRLSPTQRSIVENAVSESEGSASPEGSKARRRSSVRRVLEKTGTLVGFNLNLNAAKRATGHP